MSLEVSLSESYAASCQDTLLLALQTLHSNRLQQMLWGPSLALVLLTS